MAGEHTREDLNSRYASLQNDPVYMRLMDAYHQATTAYQQAQASGQFGHDMQNYHGPNPAAAGQAVTNYVNNHPGSAGSGLNFGPNAGTGSHRFSFDPNSGFTDDYDPWYANPGFWGPIAVGGAAAGIGLLGAAGGGGGGAAGAAPVAVGAGSAGIPGATLGIPAALPGAVSTIPALAGTAAAPAVGSAVGQGVQRGLLGASAETQYDANNAASDNGGFHLPAGAGGKILQALTALGGAGLGHVLSGQAGQGNVPPELQQMLQMALQRGKYQQPLFEAANRGMYDMLPNFARTPNATFPTGGG